ncbi:N-acetylneuraminate cytidylyltransferase [Hydrogenimonas sp.]|nr:N-acetylneuraminate cytidylyltransferase [Hydrogenimonas sp.]
MENNILLVIPARGGSKGIPRKNLRTLVGKPLITYAITTAKASKFDIDIVVTSDDDEILNIAQKMGAGIHQRSKAASTDQATLDPVIYEAWQDSKQKYDKEYGIIVTMQPTSPLLRTRTLDEAIEKMLKNRNIDTVISAIDDTHLSWRRENDRFVPNYKERLNRQYLTPTFKETGGFLITRASVVTPRNRIGENVDLFILEGPEAIDIDTYEDWNLCSYYLKRKRILFVVSGYPEIGLGHVYNTLIVANDILNHELLFLVDDKSDLAYEKIMEKNYPVFKQNSSDIVEDILKLEPDVVINDRLDTDREYMLSLRKEGIVTINFEDLGPGALEADLVINAIYPEKTIMPNHYFGHKYTLLRDEFILSNRSPVKEGVDNVLISFGGVDPNNFTKKVLEAIYDYCESNDIEINVVTGLGYKEYESLKPFKKIKVRKNIHNISDFMENADIAFISAGRTLYEIAAVGTPAIVLAQNEREMTHFFASEANGFLHLGLGANVDRETIFENFKSLADSFETRQYMQRLMLEKDLKAGRERVNRLINNVLEKQ